MNVSEFIINRLQRKSPIDEGTNIETLNYVENGYIDSLGIIQFMIDIEDQFGIEFTDEELADPSFKVVGELIKLVERKVRTNKEV